MSRQELIEKICLIAIENEYSAEQKSLAKLLLEELTARKITEEQAIEKYQKILEASSTPYWLDKFKPKRVYESLKSYQAGKLDSIGTAKMVSSLITHALIEMQLNESATLADLGVIDLADVLCVMLKSDLNESINPQLDEVLRKYGYLKLKEGE